MQLAQSPNYSNEMPRREKSLGLQVLRVYDSSRRAGCGGVLGTPQDAGGRQRLGVCWPPRSGPVFSCLGTSNKHEALEGKVTLKSEAPQVTPYRYIPRQSVWVL